MYIRIYIIRYIPISYGRGARRTIRWCTRTRPLSPVRDVYISLNIRTQPLHMLITCNLHMLITCNIRIQHICICQSTNIYVYHKGEERDGGFGGAPALVHDHLLYTYVSVSMSVYFHDHLLLYIYPRSRVINIHISSAPEDSVVHPHSSTTRPIPSSPQSTPRPHRVDNTVLAHVLPPVASPACPLRGGGPGEKVGGSRNTTPCRMCKVTPVVLHGREVTPIILHGVVSPE